MIVYLNLPFIVAVNTAARMESNGQKNRIQVSQKTADLLIVAGKEHWVTPREDLVDAKGKGKMQTYWMEPVKGVDTSSVGPSEGTDIEETFLVTGSEDNSDPQYSAKTQRLVNWNVDLFEGLLKNLIAHRAALSSEGKTSTEKVPLDVVALQNSTLPRDEVTEVIMLPEFVMKTADNRVGPNSVQLSEAVASDLRDCITTIVHGYRANPFHNFAHASHVALSTNKLLNRIVTPDWVVDEKSLHKSTYGITSDPLTHIAIVFAAVIHDIDHPGVTNAQLVEEQAPVAIRYQNKSVAEQNSVEIAWNILMDQSYAHLQACLFPNNNELKRFRQLLVNAVMATDIFDPDLKAFRESRWEKAFSSNQSFKLSSSEAAEDSNRKATIVIEHIIQASDVSHTMQHWSVYEKWNKDLFHEMYGAYSEGRTDKDPSEGWFEGELWFFDNYIIPLAKKLKECGVFGVSCDELLDFALENRLEWESKGRSIVSHWVDEYNHTRIEL